VSNVDISLDDWIGEQMEVGDVRTAYLQLAQDRQVVQLHIQEKVGVGACARQRPRGKSEADRSDNWDTILESLVSDN
jgi:hypothetical protein